MDGLAKNITKEKKENQEKNKQKFN